MQSIHKQGAYYVEILIIFELQNFKPKFDQLRSLCFFTLNSQWSTLITIIHDIVFTSFNDFDVVNL